MLRGLIFLLVMLTGFSAFAQRTIFTYNTDWKFTQNGQFPGSNWTHPDFDDQAWDSGIGTFGFGFPVATCVQPGPTCTLSDCKPVPTYCQKYITYYFRKKFSIDSIAGYPSFTFNMIRDDGAVVYVNGVEVWRSNMPQGAVTNTTLASSPASETVTYTTSVAPTNFVEGENTVAVEVHQNASNSTDLLFKLELVGNDPKISRGPYLQMANEHSVVVRWRSTTPTDSKVEAGSSFGNYTIESTDPTLTTEHEVRLAGLQPDTKYYYRIANADGIVLQQADMFFRTAPPQNTNRRIGVAVFGDCGRDDNGFRIGSMNAYRNHVGENTAELMLLLGDNAYNNGTDEEYTINFFNPFAPALLRNHVLFPSPGNHDYGSTNRLSRQGSYYTSFTMPSNAECGGVPSGTEAYYSFNWGDIHFISLDSYGHEEGGTRMYDTLGAQVQWLKSDLDANTRKWVIVYFHHPPFTMGSHNSDTEAELVNIRQNLVRILERYGVDLVLCGHSHNYERSLLMKGHYGNELTYNAEAHAVSQSSGRYDGSPHSCPYTTRSDNPGHGTVYVVSGSSGADGGVQSGYPHNAMPFSVDDGGMLYLEIERNRLDAKFLRRDQTIADRFTILKDVNRKDSIAATVGIPVQLEASWIGDYNWSTGNSGTASIQYNPQATGEQVILVEDNSAATCLADTFVLAISNSLPVSLREFEAIRKGSAVALKWSTEREEQNSHFLVERSADGRQFGLLKKVNATGSGEAQAYQWNDDKPLASESYYRLSQVDRDGKLSVLGIRKVAASAVSGLEMNVSDALDQKHSISVSIRSGSSRSAQLLVTDSGGQAVAKKEMQISQASSTSRIRVSGPGIYIVTVTAGTGQRITRRVMVRQ